MKPYPVLIEWADSTHWEPGKWCDIDELDTSPCDVVTVGWLVEKDKTCVTVASSITEAGDVTGLFVVPVGMVKKLVRLKP